MQRGLAALLVSTALACSTSTTRTAATEPAEEQADRKHCLSLARIYRSEIIDDSTILFHMRDGAIWENRLPNPCYGLRFQGGFGYMTSIDRLCDLDLIQVLPPNRNVCALGRFERHAP